MEDTFIMDFPNNINNVKPSKMIIRKTTISVYGYFYVSKHRVRASDDK